MPHGNRIVQTLDFSSSIFIFLFQYYNWTKFRATDKIQLKNKRKYPDYTENMEQS